MEFNIALLKGDGIGPEIVDSAVRVLEAIAKKYNHKFNFTPYDIGGIAIDKHGIPLPEATVKGCLASDSVLLGAVGGPKWDTLPGDKRPEKALLGIRAALENGGVVNDHHGVGFKLGRMMKEQYGPAMQVFEGIKKTLDPNGIMNPFKLGL